MVPVGRSGATPFLTGGAARLEGTPSSVGARAHHQTPDHNLEMDANRFGGLRVAGVHRPHLLTAPRVTYRFSFPLLRRPFLSQRRALPMVLIKALFPEALTAFIQRPLVGAIVLVHFG